MHIHDLIGIGFGPSNIALAIALQEAHKGGRPWDALFLEKQDSFCWHPDMLLDDAHMQISYLKDLATLRNPLSRFTFVNYLHEQGRLPAFINLKTFFPSRREFNDYLGWAARQFDAMCSYGEQVIEVQPEPLDGQVQLLRVRSRDRKGHVRERLTRNLVVGIGGSPKLPDAFAELGDHSRIWHSSAFLGRINALPQVRKVAVIGAGQSAAEIFTHLHDRAIPTQVDLVMRGRALRPSDDSPFVNEIFNADFTDHMFDQDGDTRAQLLHEFRNTNYAVSDIELIQRIFKIFYEQRVMRNERHQLLRRQEIVQARAAGEGVELVLRDLERGVEHVQRYDAVVLATGYERQLHKALLAPIAHHLGDMEVDRSYRVKALTGFAPGIYLQGACEDSHGLSDTLLSVTAMRVQEIVQSLAASAMQPLAHVSAKQMAIVD